MIRDLLIDAIAECEALRPRLPDDEREGMDAVVRQLCMALGCAVYARGVVEPPRA